MSDSQCSGRKTVIPSTSVPHPRLLGALESLRPLLLSVEESRLLPISSRFFGGLRLDVKRKLPWFPSDFYDGFHIQSISAVLFIYLGCITNAITFGGLLGDATDNYQVSTSWGQTSKHQSNLLPPGGHKEFQFVFPAPRLRVPP